MNVMLPFGVPAKSFVRDSKVDSTSLDRRRFMAYCSAMGLSGTLFPGVLYAQVADDIERGEPITVETIAHAENIAGLSFTDEEREMMVEDLNDRLQSYELIRNMEIPNEVPPAFHFDPRMGQPVPTATWDVPDWEPPPVERPASDTDLAFMTVAELSYLLKSGQVTSMELTELYLERLRRYDAKLQAVVTFADERAHEQAERADAELREGRWRGPLHGIPYGAKDLLAVEGYPTTWGAEPYRDQVIGTTASAIEKLDEAGAVLIAKLTLGALAWGDVWFGGVTKNPWNLDQGASGSSAGSAAAVSAGLVGFAVGSETLGSIVSPSNRNGITGFRPTYGTVSRYGAMALSWTMDKLGPMARSAEDCALVFDAFRGADPRDPSTVDAPFAFDPNVDLRTLRIGYLANLFEEEYDNAVADRATLEVVEDLGATLVPMQLPEGLPVGAMIMTLWVEAAAAFDDLTRSRGIDKMVRQERDAWPHVFRTARFAPAVEFIQAARARTVLMESMAEVMDEFDVFISPSFRGATLSITNLTGHPCVCLPNNFQRLDDAPRSPRREAGSITFLGGLYRDDAVLSLANAYQQATDFHGRRPPLQ